MSDAGRVPPGVDQAAASPARLSGESIILGWPSRQFPVGLLWRGPAVVISQPAIPSTDSRGLWSPAG
jgi:hypothetical protein